MNIIENIISVISKICYPKPIRETYACIGKGPFYGTLEEIKEFIGKEVDIIESDNLELNYHKFQQKHMEQVHLKYTTRDFVVYFIDWFLHARQHGFSIDDYFDYELYNKGYSERDAFISEEFIKKCSKMCNKSPLVFANKAKFNKTFQQYVKRAWLDASVCDKEEFLDFVTEHKKLFAKPVRGECGKGARIVECDKYNIDELYSTCRNEKLILEEIIKQHSSLSEFNNSTLNTIRVTTLLCADNVVRITGAAARFGRADSVIDNFHGGGVVAVVDVETGVIISDAIDCFHRKYSVHPDSQKTFIGFQYPEWRKIKRAVRTMALKRKNVRHVGWDVSVTEKGDIEFVEGNSRPGYDIFQAPHQKGCRGVVEKYMLELEKR